MCWETDMRIHGVPLKNMIDRPDIPVSGIATGKSWHQPKQIAHYSRDI